MALNDANGNLMIFGKYYNVGSINKAKYIGPSHSSNPTNNPFFVFQVKNPLGKKMVFRRGVWDNAIIFPIDLTPEDDAITDDELNDPHESGGSKRTKTNKRTKSNKRTTSKHKRAKTAKTKSKPRTRK